MKQLFSFLAAAALALAAGSAMAQVAGYVKTTSGQASIVSAGQTVAARAGMALAVGDLVRTGADGSLGITLKDNTMLSFGPSTSFTLEDFLFAPAQGGLQLGGSIAAGSLQYVSGAIARLKPGAVKIKTPTGIIGVRGTRFVAVVQP